MAGCAAGFAALARALGRGGPQRPAPKREAAWTKTLCAEQSPPEGQEVEVPIAFLPLNVPLDFLYIFEEGVVDLEALEASLCKVLNSYAPLAGRLMNGGRASKNIDGFLRGRIALNNEGVTFKVVQNAKGSAKDVEPWETGPAKGKYSVLPHPSDVAAGTGPLMTVQVTTFLEGGSVLGVTFNHIVADAWSIAMFMKDWSKVHRGEAIEPVDIDAPANMLRYFSREQMGQFVRDTNMELIMGGLKGQLVTWLRVKMFQNLARVQRDGRCVLHFSDAFVSDLKAAAEEKSGSWVSSSEALAAHLHPIFLEVFGASPLEALPPTWATGALVPVNLRGKMAGVGERSLGNLITTVPVSWDLRSAPAGGAAAVVHKAMRAELHESVLMANVARANYEMLHREYYQKKDLKVWPLTPGVILQWNYQVSNPYYEVDFGAGPPNRSIPWSSEPVKVMRGVPKDGGLDVFVGTGTGGIRSWAGPTAWHPKAPQPFRTYESLRQWLAAGLLVDVLVHASLGMHCGVALALLAARYALGKARERTIDAKFEALKHHPALHRTSGTAAP